MCFVRNRFLVYTYVNLCHRFIPFSISIPRQLWYKASSFVPSGYSYMYMTSLYNYSPSGSIPSLTFVLIDCTKFHLFHSPILDSILSLYDRLFILDNILDKLAEPWEFYRRCLSVSPGMHLCTSWQECRMNLGGSRLFNLNKLFLFLHILAYINPTKYVLFP